MSKNAKEQIQETCSCGAGVIAGKKFVLQWRSEHLHSEVREVQSATQLSNPSEPEEEYEEDEDKKQKFKIGFQIEPV